MSCCRVDVGSIISLQCLKICWDLLDSIYIRLVTSAPLMMRMRLNRMAAISMTITPASIVSPATLAILRICSSHPPQACRQPDHSCKIYASLPKGLSLDGMNLWSTHQRKHLQYCWCRKAPIVTITLERTDSIYTPSRCVIAFQNVHSN